MVTVAKDFKHEAVEFYIGRSSWPERRLIGHRGAKGYDHMCVLHWTSDKEEAVKLEADLIKALHRQLYRTRTAKSGPGGDRIGEWHALYLAWEARDFDSLYSEGSVTDVDSLDYGNRLHPTCNAPHVTYTLLRTAMPRDDARELGELAKRYRERRSARIQQEFSDFKTWRADHKPARRRRKGAG